MHPCILVGSIYLQEGGILRTLGFYSFEICGVSHHTISELSLCKHTHFHLQVYSWQCLNPILHCLLEIELKPHTKHTSSSSSHFVSKITKSPSISSLSAYCDMAIHKGKFKAVDLSRLTNIPEIFNVCNSYERVDQNSTSLGAVLSKMCSVQ